MIRPDPNCDFSGIVRGTSDYLAVQFSFSEEWATMVKVAEFYLDKRKTEPVAVPILSNCCKVPTEVTGGSHWYVRIIGKRKEQILTTNSAAVRQERR